MIARPRVLSRLLRWSRAEGRGEHGKRGAGMTVNGGGRIEEPEYLKGGSVGLQAWALEACAQENTRGTQTLILELRNYQRVRREE